MGKEVDAMFKIVGINKIALDYPDNIEPFYPEFTKEKQLEIIKLLSKNEYERGYRLFALDLDEINKEWYMTLQEEGKGYAAHNRDFADALADVVFLAWNSRSPELQKEIRNVLRERKGELD